MAAPSPGKGRKAVPKVFILLALSLVLQCFLWRGRERLQHLQLQLQPQTQNYFKRSLIPGDLTISALSSPNDGESAETGEIALTQVGEVSEVEGPEGGIFGVDYWDLYNDAKAGAKPFIFAGFILWGAFLFATIGITASDFFCPNLATVADRLGMAESTAGVTFLAFGNGSPDVFSTFSALRSNTFSLAIGELLGASCFIISVVVGCMALVQPFQVPRWPFIRDVGFFTLSVLILVGCLTDGKLTLIESGGLMILYIVYVTLVVGGNWWMNRKGQNKQLFATTGTANMDDSMRNGIGQLSLPRSSISDDLTPLEEAESEHGTRAVSDGQGLPPIDTLSTHGLGSTSYSRSRSRSSSLSSSVSERSHAPPTPTSISAATSRHVNAAFRASPNLRASDRPLSDIPRPTFSLLGAIEFRDAINTLRKEGNAGGMLTGRSDLDGTIPLGSGESHREADFSDYFGPISPFSSAHYHSHGQSQHHGHRRRIDGRNKSVTGIPRSQLNLSESSPQEQTTGGSRIIPLLATSASRGPRTSRSKSSSNIHEPRDLGLSQSSLIMIDHSQLVDEHVATASDSIPSAGTPGFSTPTHLGHRPVPSINLITADDDNNDMLYEAGETHQLYLAHSSANARDSTRERKRDKLWNVIHETFHVLFPALQGYRHKSLTGKILGVFASPAILALTLTLPVVDDEAEGCSLNKRGIVLEDNDNLDGGDVEAGQGIAYNGDTSKHFAASAGAGLHHLILDGGLPSPASGHGHYDHRHRDAGYLDRGADNSGDDPEMHTKFGGDQELSSDGGSDGQALLFNKYLTAAQCVFGSLFCSSVFFSDYQWSVWAIPAVTIAGLVAAGIVLWRAEDGQNQYWRLIRCFAGFLTAMTWIAAIADAVVDILRVFGHILGLSNAIVGLTIFAIGNSCADLIANLTVASFAPSMSYAACFGGPMLNILLGIGGAGTYVILATGHAYVVHFSSTLWVSAIGLITLLLATMCFVPYNGYWITKKWAVFLLCSYCLITILNIVVETHSIRF